jgi:hypothetical protein
LHQKTVLVYGTNEYNRPETGRSGEIILEWHELTSWILVLVLGLVLLKVVLPRFGGG